MPAHLQGTGTWKADRDIKAGEEITVATKFEADQTDFEAALRERITRAEAKGAAEAEAKLKAAADAKAAADEAAQGAGKGTDPALAQKLQALEAQVATATLTTKLNAALASAGAADLEEVFRSQIPLTPGMTDEDLKAAVTKALEAKAALVAKYKDGAGAGNAAIGRAGSGGSQDQNSQTQLSTLQAKQALNRPELSGLLKNRNDAEKLDILKGWEANRQLEPRKR